MTRDELLSLIYRFSQDPLPALDKRHVYVWHGSVEALCEVISPEVMVDIDVHRIAADLPRAPRAQDEAMKLLRSAVEGVLRERKSLDQQQIFVVTGCDVLSRYGVPAKAFFELASEQHMIIFVVPMIDAQFSPSSPLPDYVALNPLATLDYLRSIIGEAATITAA